MDKSKEVKCLCWNCGKELYFEDPVVMVNEEIWCMECAGEDKDDLPVQRLPKQDSDLPQ